ncbi:HEPN domain-containing protein [Stygiolobus sp. CP850M]|uniref:HEPN domain-containing protein n=1 Tax=Stygiolobus sp. CP850M TaxID=3133134 RepID=UPI00307EC403
MAKLIERGKRNFLLAKDALAKGYYWLSSLSIHQSVELTVKGILETMTNTHIFT